MALKTITRLGKTWLLLLFIAMTFTLIQSAKGATLIITLNTSKPSYSLGEQVSIFGNATLDGTVVSDALVAIEVDDPEGNHIILRTSSTGTIPTGFDMEIFSVTPCDQAGNPKNSFNIGTLAFFRITLHNNGPIPKYTAISLNVFDAKQVPFEALIIFRGLIYLGTTDMLVPVDIPQQASIGYAVLYVNAYTELPKNNGVAHCPEKSTTFAIIAGGGGGKTAEDGSYVSSESTGSLYYLTGSEGTYTLDFRLTRTHGKIGNYTTYVSATYQTQTATNTTTFHVFLEGDLNGDKIVDMKDIGIATRAFGSTPGHPRWNPVADVNHDLKVDMKDIGIVIRNFGKSAS
jgi:hypothetical protein